MIITAENLISIFTNAFEVVALIRQRDRRVAEITLPYAGEIV
jgi:hypothetical protein